MKPAAACAAAMATLCLHIHAAPVSIQKSVSSSTEENPAERPFSAVVARAPSLAPTGLRSTHRVEVQRRLSVSAAQAWQVLGRFCAIAQWQSLVASCDVLEREGGIVRIVVMRDHSVFTERLDEFSNGDRSFSYSLVAGPLVPPDYRATFSVRPQAEADSSNLVLKAEFSAPPTEGAAISKQLHQLFENGLNGISKLLDSQFHAKTENLK